MKIEFKDSMYRFENGHAPKGYGQWLFSFEGYTYWTSGTLTEAKRHCREYVKKVVPAGYTGTVQVNIEP